MVLPTGKSSLAPNQLWQRQREKWLPQAIRLAIESNWVRSLLPSLFLTSCSQLFLKHRSYWRGRWAGVQAAKLLVVVLVATSVSWHCCYYICCLSNWVWAREMKNDHGSRSDVKWLRAWQTSPVRSTGFVLSVSRGILDANWSNQLDRRTSVGRFSLGPSRMIIIIVIIIRELDLLKGKLHARVIAESHLMALREFWNGQ